MDAHSLTDGLYTDRYELTMAAAYWRDGRADEPAVFDYSFRTAPFRGGYAVFAGLETLLEALQTFRYELPQLDYLRQAGSPDDFLGYLSGFSFRGSIWSVSEGELVFPLEPVVRVEGGLIEAQIIETLLLNVLNFQTLIATKSARCRQAAGNRSLSEFGLRRAQGLSGLWASRAARIGGCDSTSNLAAACTYGIPTAGTMAHSFVQSHTRELEAFRRYASVHNSNTVLLLDTYNTLRSGLPNAIMVARELAARGKSLAGVRIDGGDLAYLARHVRAGLDAAGMPNVKIVVSNKLDEFVIRSLLLQRAPIDIFGVGTALATGAPDGSLDGIYKLVEVAGRPCMKVSDYLAKSTLPGRKQVARFHDGDGRFMADTVHLADEVAIRRMVHPFEPRHCRNLSGWVGEPLLELVMWDGRRVQPAVSLDELSNRARERLTHLPEEHRRFENPHVYKVALSERLCALREELLEQNETENAR